jgi:HTH-type transcriptional regulator/antitoxin HigA
MDIKVIKNDAELDIAMKRLEALVLINPEPTGDLADEIELLSLVISDYEDKHYQIEAPTPLEAIKFVMEQRDLKPKDIAPCFGTLSRTYEVLNGTRGLSLNMIRRLRQKYAIPADCLISQAPER